MLVYDLHHWKEIMSNDWSTKTLDETSENALKKAIKSAKEIFSNWGEGERITILGKTEEGSFGDYLKEYSCEMDEDEKEWMVYEYGKMTKSGANLHLITLIQHDDFYGVFVDGSYVLSSGDPNTNGYPIDATSLVQWVDESIRWTKELVERGEYEQTLHRITKFILRGSILRKTYYDIHPEYRKEMETLFPTKVYEDLKKELKKKGERLVLTSRDYFDAARDALVGANFQEKEKHYMPLKESEEEKARYGGKTSREWYMAYADGRDNGLTSLPLDDHEEFVRWLHNKGDYFCFNGNHPWELVPSGSISNSIHLFVSDDRKLELSGSAYLPSGSTVMMFLALKRAGWNVSLYESKVFLARKEERDLVRIVPQELAGSFYPTHDERWPDACGLLDDDNLEATEEAVDWEYPETPKLR